MVLSSRDKNKTILISIGKTNTALTSPKPRFRGSLPYRSVGAYPIESHARSARAGTHRPVERRSGMAMEIY
jgi:hypothetical protein